jgi:hypothetical protein
MIPMPAPKSFRKPLRSIVISDVLSFMAQRWLGQKVQKQSA